jgi:hypothetical protein
LTESFRIAARIDTGSGDDEVCTGIKSEAVSPGSAPEPAQRSARHRDGTWLPPCQCGLGEPPAMSSGCARFAANRGPQRRHAMQPSHFTVKRGLTNKCMPAVLDVDMSQGMPRARSARATVGGRWKRCDSNVLIAPGRARPSMCTAASRPPRDPREYGDGPARWTECTARSETMRSSAAFWSAGKVVVHRNVGAARSMLPPSEAWQFPHLELPRRHDASLPIDAKMMVCSQFRWKDSV